MRLRPELGPVLLLALATLGCKPAETHDAPDLVASYLALGEALAADAVTDAPARSSELLAAARMQSSQPGVAAISAAAELLPGELEPARTTYRALSEGLIEYLDAHPDRRAGLTLVYCPMAFANEGAYWVQREGKVANPYEGSRMLHCGATLSWEEGKGHRARWAAAQAHS